MYLFSEKIAATMHHLIGQGGMAFAFLSLGWASALAQPPEPPGISPADQRPELPPFETREAPPPIQLPPVAPVPPGEVAGALRLAEARAAGEIRAQARWSLETLGVPASN